MREIQKSEPNGQWSLTKVMLIILFPLAAFVAVKVLLNTESLADLRARVENLENQVTYLLRR